MSTKDLDLMKPDELIARFKSALERAYGEKIAAESHISYDRGWFYVNIARRFPDDSIGAIGPSEGYRRSKVIAEIKRIES